MKKYIVLLLSTAVVLTMFTGCRRKTEGAPGDPTVNDTTNATTVPSTTNRPNHPSTEPTMHTTVPDSTMDPGSDFTHSDESSPNEATSGDPRIRGRMFPRR